MTKKAPLIAVSALVILSGCAGQKQLPNAYDKYKPLVEFVKSTDTCQEIADSLFNRVNDVRKKYHIPSLSRNESLVDMAVSHSVEMGVNFFLGHEDYTGRDLGQRAKSFGIEYYYIGENCNASFLSCIPLDKEKNIYYVQDMTTMFDNIVNGWVNSPTHFYNMVDTTFTMTDIGVYVFFDTVCYHEEITPTFEYVNKCCKIFVTQLFLRPPERNMNYFDSF
ncbi:hypothetical protein KO465_05140 [Candidatus Micrarchaeota archaeon]|nr:hypothetical protein [Candidatus Micrarchaeota archaeon]